MKHENWIDVNDGKMDGIAFFRYLLIEFPNLTQEMSEWNESDVHMRMETFADYTINQIMSKNTPELERCFDFIEQKIDLVNSDVENAINVSYCESLLLGDAADYIYLIVERMPTKLKTTFSAYKDYYEDLTKKSRD